MKNDLFTIGSITIHGYGLMIGIGIIAAYYLAEYRANKRGMDVDMILSIAICGVVCGILGAKLLYYVTIFDEILANPKKLLDINDGFVVYGGIIGGFLFGGLACKRRPDQAYFLFPVRRSGHAVGCARAGLWTDRLFPGWLLLRYADPQPFCDRVPRFGLCPEQHSPGSDPAHLKRSGFPALPSASLCGEKVQKTGAGGIPVSDLLQSGTLRAGILPGRSGKRKCGSVVYLSVYFYFYLCSRNIYAGIFYPKRTKVG